MQRILVLTLAIVATSLLSGCTFIGMGIGAAIPKYQVIDEENLATSAGVYVDSSGSYVAASIDAVTPSSVHLTDNSDGHTFEISRDEIDRIRQRRNHMLIGGLIGGALDLAFTVLLVASVVGTTMSLRNAFSSGYHGGYD